MSHPFDRNDEQWALAWLDNNLSVTDAQIGNLRLLLEALTVENERQNLIAKGTVPFAWTRHIVDSAQLLTHVPRETSTTWLDMGTGAGFPGLVCAALAPNVSFTLVEQRPLRTEWLERARDVMRLGNVEILTQNVSALTDRNFDVISARAFAPLPRLLNLSAAFSTKATAWVLPKGRSATQELQELKGWRHFFHVEQSVTDPQSGIIIGNLLGRT
ncbi:16S rRNA (guanine(527)-N(7))-methyltransferase RsmG [Croceicoccus bisphenolivorans]|uniref:16S rRNA (guanine(527)-N(7))-methyltransferase RsmG n=1 Tax=Croceicoccus bisphenolivorans TaxID=1783232 RepID=UPI0009EE09D7|nr:16S rRNA (guanine(527)-N(7))-methyltransferase RsmG [Croceicoccus bisphenolivorans]